MRSQRSLPSPPALPVLAWRRDRLLAAGFSPAQATAIAADPRADLHAVLGLVDRGCPPALAARIVAPLDDPGPRSS